MKKEREHKVLPWAAFKKSLITRYQISIMIADVTIKPCDVVLGDVWCVGCSARHSLRFIGTCRGNQGKRKEDFWLGKRRAVGKRYN